jgi:hypothetical protein
VKPNLAAPGISIATSEPGQASDGSPLYGTVNGTSAAAATVAGAAALLAQMRPALDGPALSSLIAGYAQQGAAPTEAVGAGVLRLGASAVGELASSPTSLGFGIWQGKKWHATRWVTVRNVSSRRLQVSVVPAADQDPEAIGFTIAPSHFTLRAGAARRVKVRVVSPTPPPDRVVTGALQIEARGSETLRVPWALLFKQEQGNLLSHVALSKTSFPASDTSPAILTVQAGTLVRDAGVQIEPVRRLDILLYSAAGKYLGVMARLRDLLPGSYSFGITGRGPTSAQLAAGRYELRFAAWPTLPLDAKPSRAQIPFTIQ